MKNLKDLVELAKTKDKKIISVACCQDKEVLTAVENARCLGIVDAILVGDIDKTKEIADDLGVDLNKYELIDIKDLTEACLKSVELVSSNKADMVMKGLVDTSIILKAVLNKEVGLRCGKILSQVSILDSPSYDRLIILSDPAMNISPDLNAKKQIIENAVEVAKSMDIEMPKVACICAKEKVNPKMPDTVEAKELEDMCKNGEIKDCIVGGPLALDNAISIEAAKHKGIDNPVAGKADILLMPDIKAGNVLYKSVVFFAKGDTAGIVMGAKAPIVLTSRADSDIAKLNSIALGVLVASK